MAATDAIRRDATEITTPIVSVVMPVYNAGEYLRPAVESVLGQTLREWELILIDDGSTDSAVEEIAAIGDPRIHILRQSNKGKSAAMNRGLSQARGKYYALHDADDIALPTRLERQVACLEEHPEIAGVFCCHEVILDGRALAPTSHAKSVDDCAQDIKAERMPAHDPTAMYRLSMVREISYAEDLRVAQGVDYILRIGERYPLLVLGECLYSYRVHGRSVTLSNVDRRARMHAEVIARARQRRGQPYSPADRDGVFRRIMSRGSDNNLVSHFCTSVADLVRLGRRSEALQVGLASWRMKWWRLYYAKPLVYALLPAGAIQLYRTLTNRHRS